jgi:hypothetical protein
VREPLTLTPHRGGSHRPFSSSWGASFDREPAGDRYRRNLPLPARSGGGRLTDRTPAIQPGRREWVKVPHTCRSQYPSGIGSVGEKSSFVSPAIG